MSYDLRIYTTKRQSSKDMEAFGLQPGQGHWMLPMKNAQIVVSDELAVNEEDIPEQVICQLPGIQYLIDLNLEPMTTDKKQTIELMKLAKQIARNGHGVIENPQTEEIILPSGVKRMMAIEKTERFSVIELSWWFNHDAFHQRESIDRLLTVIERIMPEALPRRYGLFEPPQEKYSSKEALVAYFMENRNQGIVWYPSKPVINVAVSIPDQIGPMRQGYRFGQFSLEIDAAVLDMPGWSTAIDRLFRNVSRILDPFYGDMRILDNLIRKRGGAWYDKATESHPIVGWWWNGIPKNPGNMLLLGPPLLEFVQVNGKHERLDNGCILLTQDNANDNIYNNINIPKGLVQPTNRFKDRMFGFDGQYPKIWPFEGPRA